MPIRRSQGLGLCVVIARQHSGASLQQACPVGVLRQGQSQSTHKDPPVPTCGCCVSSGGSSWCVCVCARARVCVFVCATLHTQLPPCS